MADVFSKAKRSAVMARIRATGNKDTELRLMALFRAHGITGWRRRQNLPGRPDFVFRQERLVIFVDGCFWHGCPKHFRAPKSRLTYWEPKIARNRMRDRTVNRALKQLGWKVLRVWEHALSPRESGRTMARLRRALAAGRTQRARPNTTAEIRRIRRERLLPR
ncbi:MAG: very short patch repair endonuclease [Opitutaceae bacterium]